MDWLYYLLEANLYLLLFYGFYRLFLHNETFYNCNRYFLLLTSITGFILPVMQLGFLKPAPIVDNILFPPPVLYTEEQLSKMAFAPVQETFSLTDWLYPVYLIIALGFAINLSVSLFKIVRLWLKAKKAKTGKITLIELKEQPTAFSFFNLLFIHPHLAEKQTVLKHEMVHIKQKHSLDILFFELLQIICWFNPIIYFLKKDIKLLHEYIADELSTNSGIQKHEYAMFLIENSFGVIPTPLTNQIFNQSILKRRINMLNKKRTAHWARLRLLLTLPLVGAMLCASTMAFTKDYGYVDLLPEKSKTTTPEQQEVPPTKEVQQTAPKAKTAKRDQVNFPPPTVTQAYYSAKKYDKSAKKHISLENKLIIINGKELTYKNDFYGVTGADKIITLKSVEAIKKYGDKAKNGAVEVTGNKLKILNTPTDQIKFPPPVVRPNGRNMFSPMYSKDKKTGEPVLAETRLIVINGKPVEDLTKFYGVYGANSVIYRTKESSLAKYGEKGKDGAVEITGNDIKYFTKVTIPSTPPVEPPPPRQDKVRFPPPIVRPDKASGKTYYPPYKRDKYDKFISLEKRAIVVNGNVIVDKNQYYGTNEADKILFLNSADAIAKYGAEVGKFGAVEITGEKALNAFPPPIVKQDQVKFPPPIVRPVGKKLKSPPAVEPPPSGYKPSKAPAAVEKVNVTGALKNEVERVVEKRNKIDRAIRSKGQANKITYSKKMADQVKRNQVLVGATISRNNQIMQKQIIQKQVKAEQQKVKEEIRKARAKSDANNVIEGYPINANGEKIKEVKGMVKPQL